MAKNGDGDAAARYSAADRRLEGTQESIERAGVDTFEKVKIPQPSCSTCDFMRYEAEVMRCYFNPPVPAVVGTAPPIVQGAPARLIVIGLSPEVHPARFCRYHPFLRGDQPLGPP